ncbi:MAG: TonB family protein [Thermoanaerobaculia bacterium]
MIERLQGAESAVRSVKEQMVNLEQNVEQLHHLHRSGHPPLESSAELVRVQLRVEDLERRLAAAVARLNSVNGNLGAGSSRTRTGTALPASADAAPIPSGKAAPACHGPVAPGIPAGEAKEPKLLRADKPSYPLGPPKVLHDELKLELCLTIGDDGKVREARVLDGQEVDRAFHREAVSAARRWRFEPANWQGEDVTWRKQVAVVFPPP